MPNRRQFLSGALAAGAGAAVWPLGVRLGHDRAMAQALPLGVAFDAAPFTLGVASGDPTPESVILWTRLAPEPLTGGGPLPEQVEVDYVVAEDPRLRRVVKRGTAAATAPMGHSLHVDATGLEPGRTYWYRFAALGAVSRIGRTRTAPVVGVDRLRFAYVSCQDFQNGSYAAYRNLVQEDIDFVVHLGDYIYEYAGDEDAYRQHTGDEVSSLQSYRDRYALYRGDTALRACHAAFPFIVTWDDHEFDNNYANLIPEDDSGPGQDSPEAFAQRRANAYQGYYEHMPIRLTETGPPNGPDFRIYRRLQFGDLLDMSVLDTRQYRTDQPCTTPGTDQEMFIIARCQGQDDPAQTIMGPEQEQWLKDSLADSTAAWRVVAQQLMVGQLNSLSTSAVPGAPGEQLYFNSDQWDGYIAERNELLSHIAEREIPDVFVITGDIHSHWVHDLKTDFDDPDAPVVGTEFVGTSITSGGFEVLPDPGPEFSRRNFYVNNPHLRYFEGTQKGYAIVEVTRDAVTNTFRTVADHEDPFSPISTLAVFRQQRGNPLSEQLEGGDGNPR